MFLPFIESINATIGPQLKEVFKQGGAASRRKTIESTAVVDTMKEQFLAIHETSMPEAEASVNALFDQVRRGELNIIDDDDDDEESNAMHAGGTDDGEKAQLRNTLVESLRQKSKTTRTRMNSHSSQGDGGPQGSARILGKRSFSRDSGDQDEQSSMTKKHKSSKQGAKMRQVNTMYSKNDSKGPQKGIPEDDKENEPFERLLEKMSCAD